MEKREEKEKENKWKKKKVSKTTRPGLPKTSQASRYLCAGKLGTPSSRGHGSRNPAQETAISVQFVPGM
eukprot:3487679-Rhodomonas_salina.1